MKTKAIVIVCLILAATLVGVLSLAVTVSVKGYEHFSVSDKLGYDEDEVVQAMQQPKEICLAKDGVSDYVVVYPAKASQALVNDANYLANVFNEMTGAGIQALSDREVRVLPEHAFVLGDTVFSVNVSAEGVVNDGYRVFSDNQIIYIKAACEQGVRNGIYGFLEENFAVMFIEENYDYIPSCPTLYLAALDYVSNPDVAWRGIYQYETDRNSWAGRLRLNTFPENEWGGWVNGALTYIAPEKYFESNPEYFALLSDDERSSEQLCYSYFLQNQEAFETLATSFAEAMNETSSAVCRDFSTPDDTVCCQCEECKRIFEESGSMMGTLLPLVNKLAERFPEVQFTTKACGVFRQVPKGTTPADNVRVIIDLTNTSQNYALSKGGNAFSKAGKDLIEQWKSVSDNIYVSDCVVNVENLMMPYPNFGVQQSNLEYYLSNGIEGVYHRGNGQKGGEAARLRSYLLAHQLWDSDTDIESLAAKYISVAFGEAAKDVANYYDIISDRVYFLPGNLNSNDSVSLHKVDYLAVTSLNEYEGIIRAALAKTEPESREYERVERIYMSLMYTRCMDSSLNVDKKTASANEFLRLAEKYDVTMVSESESIEEWYARFNTDYLEEIREYRTALITVSAIFPMILIGFALMVATTGTLKRKIVINNLKEESEHDKDEDEIQTL